MSNCKGEVTLGIRHYGNTEVHATNPQVGLIFKAGAVEYSQVLERTVGSRRNEDDMETSSFQTFSNRLLLCSQPMNFYPLARNVLQLYRDESLILLACSLAFQVPSQV